MNKTELLEFLTFFTNSNTFCVSFSDKAFVGSSSIINSALLYIALAIATPCLSPPDKFPTGDSASINFEVKPISLINLLASLICFFLSRSQKDILVLFP